MGRRMGGVEGRRPSSKANELLRGEDAGSDAIAEKMAERALNVFSERLSRQLGSNDGTEGKREDAQ